MTEMRSAQALGFSRGVYVNRVHRPRGTCATCGRDCPPVKAGAVQAHNPPWSPWPCDGEGQAKEAT